MARGGGISEGRSAATVSSLLVALDTCVLADLESGPDEEVLSKIDTISMLRTHLRSGAVRLVLDFESLLISEYETVLPQDSLGRRFHSSCTGANYYQYASSRPTGRCKRCLERIGFDPSDVKFVGLLQPGGIYVTSEVKHLEPNTRNEVSQGCDVQILSLQELEQVFRAL